SLAFVLPAAWDYALYAGQLREKVLTSFKSVEVHRSQEPLFPDVREGRVVLVAKGYLQVPEHAGRIDHSTAASLMSALAHSIPHSASAKPYMTVATNSSASLFGDL